MLYQLAVAGSSASGAAQASIATTTNGGVSVAQATAYHPPVTTNANATSSSQYGAPPPSYGAYSGIQPSSNAGYNANDNFSAYPAAIRTSMSPQQTTTYNNQPQIQANNAAASPPTISIIQAAPNNNTSKAQQKNEEVAYSPMRMALPDVPVSFPELERLTDSQLQRLLHDTIALEVHVQAAESVASMEAVRDSQREMNAQTAANNVTLGEEVNKLRQTAVELQQKLLALANENNSIQVEIIRAEENKRKAAVNRLRQKASDLDTSSDELGTRFVAGEIDIDKFMSEYIDGRMKYHALDAKVGIATGRLNLHNTHHT